MKRALCALSIVAVLAGCGAAQTPTSPPAAATPQAHSDPPPPAPPPPPKAFVTAETENRLVVVDLKSGRVTKRIAMPADPEFVAAGARRSVVVSPGAGSVTVVDGSSGGPVKVVRGFGAPHIAEISPDGRYAYVTDDDRGELSILRLADGRIMGRVFVGAEAHHMAIRPDGRRVWIALGESARTIVIVDTADPAHPRVVGRFDPGFEVHDLLFTPDARRVWLTSSSDGAVGVFSANTRREVDRVSGGAPPQHVVFDGRHTYVTSGYGRRLELVDSRSGRVLHAVHAPYGSFNLSVGDGFVAVASLMRGTLAVYDEQLHLIRVIHIAPEARDVAVWPPQ